MVWGFLTLFLIEKINLRGKVYSEDFFFPCKALTSQSPLLFHKLGTYVLEEHIPRLCRSREVQRPVLASGDEGGVQKAWGRGSGQQVEGRACVGNCPAPCPRSFVGHDSHPACLAFWWHCSSRCPCTFVDKKISGKAGS